jgi:hypothetical protein
MNVCEFGGLTAWIDLRGFISNRDGVYLRQRTEHQRESCVCDHVFSRCDVKFGLCHSSSVTYCFYRSDGGTG